MSTSTSYTNSLGYILKGADYANLNVSGVLSQSNGILLPNEQYVAPLTGATVTINNNTSVVVIDPAAAIATLTINMPSAPLDGQIVHIVLTQAVTTTLTHSGNGNTLLHPLRLSVQSVQTGGWYYRLADTTWYSFLVPTELTNAGGVGNTGLGSGVFESVTNGANCTAMGLDALRALTSGASCVAFGNNALASITTGVNCTAAGRFALQLNTASANSAFGTNAGASNVTGANICAFGSGALQNSTANSNNAFGTLCFNSLTLGGGNCGFGRQTGESETTGAENSYFGGSVATLANGASNNTGMGSAALAALTTGDNIIALGRQAGNVYTTEGTNIVIGNVGTVADTGVCRLGTGGTHQTFVVGETLQTGAIVTTAAPDRFDSGTVFTVSQAAAYTVTLPTPVIAGSHYIFMLIAPGANNVVITSADGFEGTIVNDVTSILPATGNNLTFATGTAALGDNIEVWGTSNSSYFARAVSSAAGGIAAS